MFYAMLPLFSFIPNNIPKRLHSIPKFDIFILQVHRVLSESVAAKAGLKRGVKVRSINGCVMAGLTHAQSVTVLKVCYYCTCTKRRYLTYYLTYFLIYCLDSKSNQCDLDCWMFRAFDFMSCAIHGFYVFALWWSVTKRSSSISGLILFKPKTIFFA